VTEERIQRFMRDGLTFDVTDSGPIDGTPVVLLHGFPQRATAWNEVAARLHDAGMRTFAPDQRGYSPGARPRSRFAYGMKELVADNVALIDEIGGQVHLVGHDWGGAVGWAIAVRHRDRIASLVAVSLGHARAWLPSMVMSDQARRSYYMLPFQTSWAEHSFRQPGGWGERLMRSWGMDDEMLARMHREIVGDGALRGALNWYRSMFLGSVRDFATVRVPTTFVWGDADATIGPVTARRTERFVDASYRFVQIPGANHFPPEERPAEVAAAIIDRVRSIND
jgi:pimeloyl-ACP methyl ester carboxylesterase